MLQELFRRFRATPLPSGKAPDPLASREQRLAERLLEDEALRDDLDDATWQPIQDWLLAAVRRVASSTVALDDAAAQPVLDDGQARLRSVVTTLTDALTAGPGAGDFARRLEPLHGELQPPIVEAERARRVHAALRSAARELAAERADPATAAARLAGALDAGASVPVPPAPTGQA